MKPLSREATGAEIVRMETWGYLQTKISNDPKRIMSLSVDVGRGAFFELCGDTPLNGNKQTCRMCSNNKHELVCSPLCRNRPFALGWQFRWTVRKHILKAR